MLFRVRAGAWEINSRTWRWNGNEKSCMECGRGVEETLEHIVVGCEAYEEERMILEENMKRCIGEERWEMVKETEDYGMAYLVGLEEQEEEDMVERVNIMKKFLTKVWWRREEGVRQIREFDEGEGRVRHRKSRDRPTLSLFSVEPIFFYSYPLL